MSYCRFSSDDFNCDIYAYESCYGGYMIHIASNRVVGNIPKTPPLTEETIKEYATAHKLKMDFLETAKREKINLPFAGETFGCETLEEFEARLIELKNIGYRFPDYVFERINQEKEELKK